MSNLSILLDFVDGEGMPELCDPVRASRKRTAARLWVMRRQLREAEGGICVIGCYSLDVQERREAVQKVRDEVKP